MLGYTDASRPGHCEALFPGLVKDMDKLLVIAVIITSIPIAITYNYYILSLSSLLSAVYSRIIILLKVPSRPC